MQKNMSRSAHDALAEPGGSLPGLAQQTVEPQVSNVNYLGPPYGNYFCRFLRLDLRRFLLKLSMMVGFGSTIALDLHHIQNDGVMDDAVYRRHYIG